MGDGVLFMVCAGTVFCWFVSCVYSGDLLGCSGDACCWCAMCVYDGVLEIGYGDACGV